jgi:crotonobetainyl-CoA:carnitine CoA-transferase CaiB-like acyl-CoA transferase
VSQTMKGIRVLEVAQWWFVPASTAILADWGADVIKVEHPVTGDPMRGLVTSGLLPDTGGVNFMVEQSNRGKKSVGIDIATDGGREVLYRLVRECDVFVTSFLPDARRRLQIDVEHIRAINPDIVYVRGSGQGVRGPDAEKGGFDGATFWCRGGNAAALTPPDAEAPAGMPGPAYGDSIGAMTIAGGIAAALLQRERTGETSVVDVSLLGASMWVMGPMIVASKLMGAPSAPPPKMTRQTAPNPLVNSYPTKDGRWITLCMLQPDRYWADLCEHIGRNDLIEDARFANAGVRFENREACVGELDAAFGSATLAEWRERLVDLAGVWAPVQTAAELNDDPQAQANGYLREVEGGNGKSFSLVASPVQFDETPPELTAAPELGANTEQVLLDLGLSWDDLTELKASNAIS